MTSGTRGKWSAVGTIVSAPVRGYYYPGRVHAIKRSNDGTSPALYSIIFSDPLGSLDPPESGDLGLIQDFSQSEIIGRGFEPITKALLSKNQKVFITFKGKEVSAKVEKHEDDDSVNIIVDGTETIRHKVKLHELRLLPSRKSARIQEHVDYSLLANGRRSPTDMDIINSSTAFVSLSSGSAGTTIPAASHSVRIQKSSRRRTTSSSVLETGKELPSNPTPYSRSAHIDVPSGPGARKRRPSQNQASQMDECTAALVLMSLSASPRSPTFLNERLSLYRCTWPGCSQECVSCSDMEKHVRTEHLQASVSNMGEEEFYYTEIDIRDKNRVRHPSFSQINLNSGPGSPNIYTLNTNSQSAGIHSSSGPDSPLSLSEDAASTSSSGVMTMGDNSMDSSPPASPMSGHNPPSHYSRSSGASSLASSGAIAVPANRFGLDEHDYYNRKSSEGMSLLSSSAGSSSTPGRCSFGVSKNRTSGINGSATTKSHGMSLLSSSPSTSGPILGSSKTRPINIPTGNANDSAIASSSFGGFAGSHGSIASSGFGSFQSFGTGSPLSPVKLSSSLSNSSKYLKLSATPRSLGASGSGAGAVHLIQQANRTSPTKRVRGEMRKCRKVYGMEKKDAWCTQCKWKKACTRFQD